jgi:hypothetical protein
MAIPWIIGGAVVAAATWALSDNDTSSNSGSDRDYERRKMERDAERAREKASTEAEKERRLSKVAHLKLITEQQVEAITSEYALNIFFVDKGAIANVFMGNGSSEKALNGLNDAFIKSDTVIDLDKSISNKASDIKEMKNFLQQLRCL